MDRREFIKKTNFMGAGAIVGGHSLLAATDYAKKSEAAPNSIKNVLFFFVDQQRQDCLGCYGNPIVKTPNIDRLAANGVRFTNAFTSCPLCTPARTSVQTGLLPHNHGLLFNTHNPLSQHHLNVNAKNDTDSDTFFFSHGLKEKGWQLGHVGKWHIGYEKNKPSKHGYKDLPHYPLYGYPRKHPHYLEYLKKLGVDGFHLRDEIKDPAGVEVYSGIQKGPQEASIPAYLANQTIDCLKDFTKNGKPFFLSCNFWGPHAPYYITEKHYNMYQDYEIEPWDNFDCDLSDKPDIIRRAGQYWRTGWMTRKELSKLIGRYYGYITLIDEEIGRVLNALEESGELDNTLIVYSADHGSSVGAYRMWDKGFGMYDPITRIPMIISHPSLTPSISNAYVSLIDLAPTFLDIAGYPLNGPQLDGKSLIPVISGKKQRVRDNNIVVEHHGHQLPFVQRMVRTDSFKYIHNPESFDEFYNLENDPNETRNIISSVDRNQIEWSKEILREWMKDTGDPMWFWSQTML